MNKIQHFEQKEKQIFIGLEDSKRTWHLCIRSGGVIMKETSMPAKFENLRTYLQNKYPNCHIQVIYEAGFRGFTLHDQVVAHGWDCVVTPPHTVTTERCSRRKNDTIDSRRLATILEGHDYKQCHVPPVYLREDRQVSRLYGQIKNDIVRVANRIRRTLEFHGIDEQFPPGKWSAAHYRRLAQNLDHMDISPTLHFACTTLCQELQSLRQYRCLVLKQLRQLGRSERYQKAVRILYSVPGIGQLTAIRLALELGDIARFPSKEDFVSFLGLTPSEDSSGPRERRGHITKQGSRSMRTWLIECSWIAIQHDDVLMDRYQTVFHNTGSKKKAIVAVARKLAIRLRTLLLTQQTYVIGTIN